MYYSDLFSLILETDWLYIQMYVVVGAALCTLLWLVRSIFISVDTAYITTWYMCLFVHLVQCIVLFCSAQNLVIASILT